MRNILLLCFLLFVLIMPARSQLTRGHNHPRCGDELIKSQVQYTSPGAPGAGQLWDFSQLKPVTQEYPLTYTLPGMLGDSLYILGKDTIPSYGVSGDELLIGTEHHTMYYYQLRGDTLYRLGHENPGTQLFYHDPLPVLKYPMNYGDVILCPYSGQGLYGGQIPIATRGTLRIHADAHGSMILPSGDTLTSVLRIKTTQMITELAGSEQGTNAGSYIPGRVVETHQWYTKGYRYPVFETVRSTHLADTLQQFATAFFFPPQAHYYLDTDAPNVALLDSLWELKNAKDSPGYALDEIPHRPATHCAVYPNPVEGELTVSLTFTATSNVSLSIKDMQGRTLFHSPERPTQSGRHYRQIDFSPYPPGNYLLTLLIGREVISHKIIKK